MTAPHTAISDSYAAWASTTTEAVALDDRHGSRYRRANCPDAIAPFTYSGVPNAGEPVRMSTFDVNAPYTTGAPGRTSWVRATQNSASAFCWAIAAASVTGVMAPASVNGVATTAWPASAIAISPSLIGPSRRRGELVLMIVIRDGSAASRSRVTPRASPMISSASSTTTAPNPRQCQVLSSVVARQAYMSR